LENVEEAEFTPSEMYKTLNEHAKDMGIGTRQKSWPKAPNAMSRQFNRLIPSLKKVGIEVIRERGEKRSILIVNDGLKERKRKNRAPALVRRLEEALFQVKNGSETVEEVAEKLGIKVEGTQKLLNTLERDELVYQPRPGIWKPVSKLVS
jgi:hypothetical protein